MTEYQPEQADEFAAPTVDEIAAAAPADAEELGSIVDTILELDQLLSADVRRAEDVFRLYRRGDLLAKITELHEWLAALTDDMGRPLSPGDEEALGEGGQVRALALELEETRKQCLRESGLVRLLQLEADDWEAFKTKWKSELAKPEGPATRMWNALIAATISEPAGVTDTSVIKMRQLYGAPQIDALGKACWDINTQAGVSVPKSPLSSLVLKRLEHETN